MKAGATLILFAAGFLAACGGTGGQKAQEPMDRVAETGVTQPSPPEPGTIAGNNPRDPQKRRERPVSELSHPGQPSEAKPAPEDSEVSAMMNPDGSITEFRVFKSHQEIEKVEANWMMPDEKVIKVYLKGGRVLEVKTDRVPQLSNAASSLLLEIVTDKGPRGPARK